MSAWTVVPSLLSLRAEFDQLAPHRDRGADGTIADAAHAPSSDHTADEDSPVLRDRDSDHANEVHALDIDSTGPWPLPFGLLIDTLILAERKRWRDPHDVCRLEYVIWDRQIYRRERDFLPEPYRENDPHTGHAHFSARYLTAAEADTRPWGLLTLMEHDVNKAELFSWLDEYYASARGKKAICNAVYNTDDVIPAPGRPTEGNTYLTGASYVMGTYDEVRKLTARLDPLK